MPPKIKFIIGSLAIVAIGVLAVGMSFLRTNFSGTGSLAPGVSDKLSAMETDSDKDGLSDIEESYWNTDFQNSDSDGDGFLDGEEVVSGHDPLKPGPDDLLTQANLTEKVTDLLIGGLYSGDLGTKATDATFDKALGDLSVAAISEFYDPKAAAKPPVVRTVATTKASEEIYLNKIAQIIKQNLFSQVLDVQASSELQQQKSSFLTLSNQFSLTRDELLNIEVPINWKNFHATLIGLITRFKNDYGAVGNYDRDPIRAMVALNELRVVLGDEIRLIIKDLRDGIAKRALNPSDTFFNVLGLLGN
ncbi:MAG: hypothetical protein AAB667_00170 [Patescibacteria group bacterium]